MGSTGITSTLPKFQKAGPAITQRREGAHAHVILVYGNGPIRVQIVPRSPSDGGLTGGLRIFHLSSYRANAS